MNTSATIREAREADNEHWTRMRQVLWPDAMAVHSAEIEAYFRSESVDIVQAYVVEDEPGSIIGFMELNIRNFAEGSRRPKVPYVEAWFIDKPWRGRGLGKRLMLQAEAWAQSMGFDELASDTDTDNEASIAAHQRLGFRETERVVCFLKQLNESNVESQNQT